MEISPKIINLLLGVGLSLEMAQAMDDPQEDRSFADRIVISELDDSYGNANAGCGNSCCGNSGCQCGNSGCR